jgi:hypothetical protein
MAIPHAVISFSGPYAYKAGIFNEAVMRRLFVDASGWRQAKDRRKSFYLQFSGLKQSQNFFWAIESRMFI